MFNLPKGRSPCINQLCPRTLPCSSGQHTSDAPPTSRKPRTVQGALEETIAAITELRAAALLGQDEQRAHIADGLEERFANVTDRRGLREASARSLGLYRGGSGSFRDVGYEAAGNAVDRLYVALRRGRSWFLRNS